MTYLIGFCAGVLASIVLMIVFDGMEADDEREDNIPVSEK